jgi:hypothetical protein
VEKLANREQFLERLASLEQLLLTDHLDERPAKLPKIDPAGLDRLFNLLPSARGKVLFLETMGFADPEVMAGEPCHSDLAAAERSYGERLLPRHHVLARLAREGLAPTLLTTNFDLLLEGAYRLAGLAPRFLEGVQPAWANASGSIKGAPPATFDSFSRIASATQFFGRGDDRRSAHLLKIHGCSENYRWVRDQTASLQAYLPALVFTFREIQNWREDSWSRDLLSNLLRTRSIVFCGYSGADPVLHDTIRTVYEEMSRRRGPRGEGSVPTDDQAPAFFLGLAGKTEFHGMEILRAASRAVGGSPGLTDHPNYLHFHPVPKTGSKPFPLLDEMMRWLFHLVFRRRQRQALESDLGRVVTVFLGYPCPEAERKATLSEFEALLKAENVAAGEWDKQPDHRIQFERMVGWTERFHIGLLREFALAEAALRSSGPGLEFSRLRRSHWYYPTLDHSDWAAWGVVVELALRRRIAAWQGLKEDWEQDRPWVSPATGSHPAVLYSHGASRPTPSCLTLRLRTPGGRVQAPAVRGACRRHCTWELDYGEIPWRREEDKKTPGAATLWGWAHRPLARLAGGELEPF